EAFLMFPECHLLFHHFIEESVILRVFKIKLGFGPEKFTKVYQILTQNLLNQYVGSELIKHHQHHEIPPTSGSHIKAVFMDFSLCKMVVNVKDKYQNGDQSNIGRTVPINPDQGEKHAINYNL